MKNYLFAWIAAIGCIVATTAYAKQDCIEQNYCEQATCQISKLFEGQNRPGFYVGALGGVNFLSDMTHSHRKAEFDAGYLVGATVGYQFCAYRVEGEFAYRHNSVDLVTHFGKLSRPNLSENTYSLMFNGYWDVNVDYSVKPYIGFGIGHSWDQTCVKHKRYDVTRKANSFAWQAIVGGAYDFNENVKLSAEYRYFSNDKTNQQALIFAVKHAL